MEEQMLQATDGSPGERFGYSVSVNGDVIVAGATFDDIGNLIGSAYVFRHNGFAWQQEQKLTPNPTDTHQFGFSVAVEGDVALIGANDGQYSISEAYIFRYNGTWSQDFNEVEPQTPVVGDLFGTAVALDHGIAVVGARWDDEPVFNSGAAYIFGVAGDCDANNAIDFCQIAFGASLDLNNNMIPDHCESIGACCLLDGSCTFETNADCSAAGGMYQGDGTTCDPNPCPPPEGACCFPDESCLVLTQDDCNTQGGSYDGDNTACDPNPCLPGACCFSGAACQELTPADCASQGGDYQGDGTDCIVSVPGDFATIQDAIDASCEGGEVVVADGTYTGGGNKNINLGGKAITVRSASGNPSLCIIDCEGSGRGFKFISGETASTVVNGFTITGGIGGGGGGGGAQCQASSPMIVNCVFEGNDVGGSQGGGMSVTGGSSPTIMNCQFISNSAKHGGGLYGSGSSPDIINCSFIGNDGWERGGGMQLTGQGHTPSVTNCTFYGNTSPDGGAIHPRQSVAATISNCILWGNSSSIEGDTVALSVTFSDVEGGFIGTGNIDTDPMFVGPGDFHLLPGSPCIDAGENAAVPKGITTDLDGSPRFVDDPDTLDCQQAPGACGDPPVVDMGAYEFQAVPPCPWDLDGEGIVGITDFLALLASWGSCDEVFTVQVASNDSHLATVDRDGCDIASLPTQVGIVMLGMGFDPSTDTLFATGLGAGSPNLYEVDRMTGAYTLIGPTGTLIAAMAIHPETLDLYGMTLSGSLYLIDKTDGSVTLLGSDPVDLVAASGMAFSPDGVLYVSDTSGDGTSGLFVVDPATGDATLQVTIDRNTVTGLDFGADGMLYGTDNQTDTVITIDQGSGVATEVCPFGPGFGHPTLELAPEAGGPDPDCAADLDGDGVVGITDFLALLAHWGPCP
jgi:hypothetical protein